MFATYFVAVTTSSGYRWTLPKRFSQFYALHARIKAAVPGLTARLNLKLPGKKYISSSISPRTVQKRRVGLESYLVALSQFLEKGEKKEKEKLDEIVRAFLSAGDSVRVKKELRCSRMSSLQMEEKVNARSSAFRASISVRKRGKSRVSSFEKNKVIAGAVDKLARNKVWCSMHLGLLWILLERY